jgi:hypothetical protein
MTSCIGDWEDHDRSANDPGSSQVYKRHSRPPLIWTMSAPSSQPSSSSKTIDMHLKTFAFFAATAVIAAVNEPCIGSEGRAGALPALPPSRPPPVVLGTKFDQVFASPLGTAAQQAE